MPSTTGTNLNNIYDKHQILVVDGKPPEQEPGEGILSRNVENRVVANGWCVGGLEPKWHTNPCNGFVDSTRWQSCPKSKGASFSGRIDLNLRAAERHVAPLAARLSTGKLGSRGESMLILEKWSELYK